MANHKLSLHIFRRDLRLEDNTALIASLKQSDKVIPCFILDKKQINNNEYKADNLVEFMINCLKELDENLRNKGSKLYLFYDNTEHLIEKLLKKRIIQAVYFNADYTPYSKTRDDNIKKICQEQNVECNIFHDALINAPGTILKDDGKPYTIFTPFFRKAKTNKVSEPVTNNFHNYYNKELKEEISKEIFEKILSKKNDSIILKGGSKEATFLIEKSKHLQNYSEEKNIPSKNGTTLLSAHNKFGTVSIRKVYWEIISNLGAQTEIISELYWRDFFTHIIYHHPQVLGESFHKKYNNIRWKNNEKKFKAWCEGRTGFPIVDAGMRQLNATGWMHNRLRMIVASFLVKDLHIDWRRGEKYFAQKLIDYDPAVNNGNWQWAASTGCDAQPYFRIFNPWKQQEKFDTNCEYIKKWVPELKNLSSKDIHKSNFPDKIKYPKPIVDHALASSQTKAMYALVAKNSQA